MMVSYDSDKSSEDEGFWKKNGNRAKSDFIVYI